MADLNRRRTAPADGSARRECDGIDRRTYLRLGAVLGAGAATGVVGMTGAVRGGGNVETLADPAPTDREVGGGDTYTAGASRSDATAVVGTKTQLLGALADATDGDVVYVDDAATIDLTGVSSIGLADGVTLASGRGRDGSDGGLIHTDEYADPLFKVYGDRVRFSGLRIQGPRWDYFDPADVGPYAAEGIWFLGADGQVDNCQLYGWPHAAVSVGSRGRTVSAHVHHSSIHDNAMEGLGYGVNLYNGHSLIEHTYFDGNRHSITAFGHETNGYEARYNLVGPSPISHAFDVHNLSESSDGGNVAGGTIHVHHNSFQFTHDTLERGQEAVTVRGVPNDWVTVEKNWFYHSNRPDDEDVDANGQAYRQCNLEEDKWIRFTRRSNHYGRSEPPADVGCPRRRRTIEGEAVDPRDDADASRSGVTFQYENGFSESINITDLSISADSESVVALNDPSYDVGQWQSEVFTDGDLQDGTTDVGGGLMLPGTIDLDSSGHSGSPDTEPMLSGGSVAPVNLYQFVDESGAAHDMGGETLVIDLWYRLASGTTGKDSFLVDIAQVGELTVGQALAVDPASSGARSGISMPLRNRFGQSLAITDIEITPDSGKVGRLSDPTYGIGQWASEVHVSADLVEGVCDVGGGTSLPAAIDLDADGYSASGSVEPVLSGGSGATVSLFEFRKRNGRPLDMVGQTLTVTLRYRLADGTSETKTVTVTPVAG